MRLLKQGMTPRSCDPLITQTHDLQELSKTYLHIPRARTRLQHILLTHYLTVYFAEIERCWSSQRNEWFTLLLRFATPASISAVSVGEVRDAIWRLMGRRVHKAAKIAEIELLLCIRSQCPSPQAHLRSALYDCSSSAICSYVRCALRCKAKLMRFWPTISIISGLKLLLVSSRSSRSSLLPKQVVRGASRTTGNS
jgi:hypothetical protein